MGAQRQKGSMQNVEGIWEESDDIICTCRNGVRKAKAQLGLKLAGQETGRKTDFCKYTMSKGKAKEKGGHCTVGQES